METLKLITELKAKKIKKSLVNELLLMIFGSTSFDLNCFTDPKCRKNLPDSKIVWKNGKSRFPHVNKATGVLALYENSEIFDLMLSDSIINIFRELYQNDRVVYSHGPIVPIIKPNKAGRSPPYMYSFNSETDLSEKYTLLLNLSEPENQIEILSGFKDHYDLFVNHYNVELNETLTFVEKWFKLPELQKLLDAVTINQNKVKLEWTPINLKPGEAVIISSKDLIRTTRNNFHIPHVLLQIHMQPDSNWKNRITIANQFKSGKYGDWSKPGVRTFLRENSTESQWRQKIGRGLGYKLSELSEKEKTYLGL